MKKKWLILSLVLVLVLAGGAALLLLRQQPLTEHCPQLAALPAEEVSVGYWPTSSTSPFYAPLTPGEPHLLDEVVTLSVPADVLAEAAAGTAARLQPFSQPDSFAARGQFFLLLPGEETALILSADTARLVEGGGKVTQYGTANTLYEVLEDYLEAHLRGEAAGA